MAMSTSESTLSAGEQLALVELSKKAAAHQAVKDHLSSSYRHVGIGSGSTVIYVVDAIASLDPSVTSQMSFYPTGAQSRGLIEAARLKLCHIKELPSDQYLDVSFDGADEVDDDLNLIKGGGACLYQEKVVATSAKKFVCVADFRKLSPRLGTNWKKGIPLEVLPEASGRVLAELGKMGSIEARIRPGPDGKALVTDNGHFIIDAPFTPLLLPKDLANGIKGGDGINGTWTVDALADRLIKVVGIDEIGIFHGKNGSEMGCAGGAQKPVAAYFGMQDGSVKVINAE